MGKKKKYKEIEWIGLSEYGTTLDDLKKFINNNKISKIEIKKSVDRGGYIECEIVGFEEI